MIYLFLAVVFYSISLLIGASASRNANTNLVSFLNTLFSSIIPFFVIAPTLSRRIFQEQRYGVLMAILSGFVVSLFVLSLSKSFTQNRIGIITPVVYGGAIVITTVASYFIFKERISLVEGFGLVLVLAGLSVIIYARATTAA